MTQSLPTLSSAGYVRDPAQILDNLLAYFFVSDYSQSTEHYGRVSSLPWLIKTHTNRPELLARECEETLKRLLGNYYDNVDLAVSVVENNTDPSSYDIQFQGTVNVNGRSYQISRLANIANDKLRKTTSLTLQ